MALSGKYALVVLAGTVMLSAGCIGEDLADCPDTEYGLRFIYTADGSADVFSDYIDHVGMYLYAADGDLLLTRELSRDNLSRYRGATLEGLGTGTYTVVCWANAGEYTDITGAGELSRGRVYQSQYVRGETVTDFDPLYYGSRTVYIDPAAGLTDTLEFVSAHINMEIFIAGYGDLPDTGEYAIRLDGVPVGYDFRMDDTAERSGIYPEWETDQDGEIIYSSFRLFRFGNDNDIVINVLGTDGTVRAQVGLAAFLEHYGINIEGVNEVTVPVYILFRGPEFYVSVDGWNTTPVEPAASF